MTKDLQTLLQKAFAHHQAGRLEQAKKGYLKALKIAPDIADAHHLLAIIYGQSGNPDNAAPHAKKAVELQGDNPAFLATLGSVKKEKGFPLEAVDLYERSLRLNPQSAQTFCNLGSVLRNLNRLEEAIAATQTAISLAPDFPEAHHILGVTYKDRLELDKSELHHRKALALKPGFMKSTLGLSRTLKLMGRIDEAKEILEGILERDPNHIKAIMAMGVIDNDLGDMEAASACYKKVLSLDPGHAEALFLLTTIKKTSPESDLPSKIEALLEKKEGTDTSLRLLHFALGKAHDDMGAFEAAFKSYRQGNQIRENELALTGQSYDPEVQSAHVSNLIATFSTDFFKKHTDLGSDSQLPVFIFGMPRSGTTLVEQIISSHPDAVGAGELMLIPNAVAALPGLLGNIPYPECMRSFSPNVGKDLSAFVINSLKNLGNGTPRVCDKMPQNFIDLGLMATLFPNATYIHCRRDPLDTCLSIYFQDFTETHPYASDFAHIGHYYREYERLMDHWRKMLPVTMVEVDYENLIADQEKESHGLIEACGLPWDDACLSFHETERNVQTASLWQVRQPIYKTSMERWKNYEKFLGPLKDALGKE